MTIDPDLLTRATDRFHHELTERDLPTQRTYETLHDVTDPNEYVDAVVSEVAPHLHADDYLALCNAIADEHNRRLPDPLSIELSGLFGNVDTVHGHGANSAAILWNDAQIWITEDSDHLPTTSSSLAYHAWVRDTWLVGFYTADNPDDWDGEAAFYVTLPNMTKADRDALVAFLDQVTDLTETLEDGDDFLTVAEAWTRENIANGTFSGEVME